MKKKRSLNSKLFLNLSVLVVAVEFAIVGFFYFYTSNEKKEQSTEILSGICISLSDWLQDEITNMEEIAFRIAYSSLVIDSLSNSQSGVEVSPLMEYDHNRYVTDILNVSIGYYRRFEQINLYSLAGKVIRTGYNSDIRSCDLMQCDWYPELLSRQRDITLPYYDSELRQTAIALRMILNNRFHQPIGVIEVIQSYDIIKKKVASLTGGKKSASLSVFFLNEAGEIAYPLYSSLPEGISSITATIPPADFNMSPAVFYYEDKMMAVTQADHSGWKTLVIGTKKELFSDVSKITKTFLIIGMLSICISLAVSYTISYKLSSPLQTMDSLLNNLARDIDHPMPAEGLESGVKELENLYQTFLYMQASLRQSLDQTIIAKQEEMNAKILALYSQMNPHFLYNILSVISVLAEENETDEIVSISKDLSTMLRYIAGGSNSEGPVSIELEHTLRYLKLMKYRYEDGLEYSLDTSCDSENIIIPKLSVQPIVENIFKHGFKNRPPWNISIIAEGTPDCWTVSITDNGTGFSDKALREWREKIRNINPQINIVIPDLEGLGLLNIYIRMKILYGDRFEMNLQNTPEGGAMVSLRVKGGC